MQRRAAIAVAVAGVMLAGCATSAPPTTMLSVRSEPQGALVTVEPESSGARTRTAVGLTPVVAEIVLAGDAVTRLRIEKRGYRPEIVAVSGVTASIVVPLEPLPESERSPAASGLEPAAVVLVGPEVELVRRRFAGEGVSDEDSAQLADLVAAAVAATVGDGVAVIRRPVAESAEPLLRDVRVAARLIDPVRLPYLPVAPRLETARGREAAAAIGRAANVPAVLYLSGRSTVETASMAVGKAGIMVAGTVASSGAGASRAAIAGDSTFVYTVYLPESTGGARLDAALVDARTGEVLWVARGIYPPLDPDEPRAVAAAVDNLLAGAPIIPVAADASATRTGEE